MEYENSTTDDVTARLNGRISGILAEATALADERAHRECGYGLAGVALKRFIERHEATNGAGNWRRLHYLRYNYEHRCWEPRGRDGGLLFDPLWHATPADLRPSYNDFSAAFHHWRFPGDRGPIRRGWDIGRLKGVWAAGGPGDDKLALHGPGGFERDYNDRLAKLVNATENPALRARMLIADIEHSATATK
jgi:hypothetical protein